MKNRQHIYLVFSQYEVGYDQKKHTLYVISDGACYSYYPVTEYAYSQIIGGNQTLLHTIMGSIVPTIEPTRPKVLWTAITDGIEMYDVNSSTVEAVGYDEKTSTLYVDFKNGGVYAYENVPMNYWQALQQADSKGSWTHWFLVVNDDEFPYRKVSNADLVYNHSTTPNTGSPHPEGYMTGF